MSNPTFAALPIKKCKLMLKAKNPSCFYSKTGNGSNQIGVYCLPSEFMAIVCPCGIIKNSYTPIKNHLDSCRLFKDLCADNEVDDVVANELASISLEAYQEAATIPKVGTYRGKLYLYHHHKYSYVCPCGISASTQKPSAGYHNLWTYHFTRFRNSKTGAHCCKFIDNILQPSPTSAASAVCFEPSPANFDSSADPVVVTKKRKSITLPPSTTTEEGRNKKKTKSKVGPDVVTKKRKSETLSTSTRTDGSNKKQTKSKASTTKTPTLEVESEEEPDLDHKSDPEPDQFDADKAQASALAPRRATRSQALTADIAPDSGCTRVFIQSTVPASTDLPIESTFPNGKCYHPMMDKNWSIICPSKFIERRGSDYTVFHQDQLNMIQRMFQENYDEIVGILTTKSNISCPNWNAFLIEKDRYCIEVSQGDYYKDDKDGDHFTIYDVDGDDFKGQNDFDIDTCWTTILGKYLTHKNPGIITERLLKIAKEYAMRTYDHSADPLYHKRFFIIFEKNQKNKEPNVDVFESDITFSMSLTSSESSTSIFDISSIDERSRLTSITRLVKFLYKISLDGSYKYTPLIVDHINANTNVDFSSLEDITKLSTLFNICSPKQISSYSSSNQKHFRSMVLSAKNTPVGTVTRLNNRLTPQRTNGCSNPNQVCTTLFWNGCVDTYDLNDRPPTKYKLTSSPDTKFTLMAHLARSIWPSANSKTKETLLAFVHTAVAMSETIDISIYSQFPTFVRFCEELTSCKSKLLAKSNTAHFKKIFKSYAKEKSMFTTNSVYNQFIIQSCHYPKSFWSSTAAIDNQRIHKLMKAFAKTMLSQKIGSRNGLRACLINPGDNGPRINFDSPQAFSEFFGKDIYNVDDNLVFRTAYGINNASMSTGFHPTQFVVRPFCPSVLKIVNLVIEFALKFLGIKLDINSFEMKIYVSKLITCMRVSQSKINYHNDLFYKNNGQPGKNTADPTAPALIYTIGGDRRLDFCWFEKTPGDKWKPTTIVETTNFLQEDGSLFVVQPGDDKPRKILGLPTTTLFKTKHCVPSCNDGISVAFIFRKVNSGAIFDTTTNLLQPSEQMLSKMDSTKVTWRGCNPINEPTRNKAFKSAEPKLQHFLENEVSPIEKNIKNYLHSNVKWCNNNHK